MYDSDGLIEEAVRAKIAQAKKKNLAKDDVDKALKKSEPKKNKNVR